MSGNVLVAFNGLQSPKKLDVETEWVGFDELGKAGNLPWTLALQTQTSDQWLT